ncbi:mannitol-1-phosphate 5-dehydrogenase [Halalkalibacter wakoensis JCM 9140]|uniref:Mannitol-1-phosphate 5-dehydrogenase n=1 Tax=Halalkalibacter wakoensis JCM 9140 TaxID=1236970 RepID=W4Q2Z0_9BACI|nr:mannitol-1-phosphate 5-dehydrogenase [Halalkalibacter wakoensis]GAE26411.1 mannitol-1-phosphate 5-dehydrogenase [Halalkalibacter wakoensis JCM 9140]
MKAVHFGAGNIGRGFIGSLLYDAGYETIFVDVNKEIVDLLNARKEYNVVLAAQSKETVTIKNVSAINSMEHPDHVLEAIAEADLITTAVGPTILPTIAKSIAQGLRLRVEVNKTPLNIIACENLIGGSTILKEHVFDQLSEAEKNTYNDYFAFPDAAVDRIVPNQVNEDKLQVMVEPYYEWVVERSKMIGVIPQIDGITYVDDLKPYIERKLFTVNTGHAVAAYLGYHANIQTIDQALDNKDIRNQLEQTLLETGTLLSKKHGFDLEEHKEYIEKIIKRFLNVNLADDVTRVGRGPLRKLGPNDRLVGPAKQFVEIVKEEPVYLAKAIAAAFHYDVESDDEAFQVQQLIEEKGIRAAVTEVTKLESSSHLFELIVEQYEQLKTSK